MVLLFNDCDINLSTNSINSFFLSVPVLNLPLILSVISRSRVTKFLKHGIAGDEVDPAGDSKGDKLGSMLT